MSTQDSTPSRDGRSSTAPQLNSTENKVDILEAVILDAVHQYFEDCRSRLPDFVDRQFGFKGAWRNNKVAFGGDILRAPLNLFWAPFYALICLARYFLNKVAIKEGSSTNAVVFRSLQLLNRAPSGLNSEVQKQISNCVRQDLLNDIQESNQLTETKDEKHSCTHSLSQNPHDNTPPLIAGYISNAVFALQYSSQTISRAEVFELTEKFEPLIQESLQEYEVTRNASADISNGVSCTILGAFAFQKFTPGGIGIGFFLASILSNTLAAKNFIFGETLGSYFYGFFPAEPSMLLTALSMAFVLALLAACAAFSGLITDPIQSALGLHQRRLRHMLNAMEADFMRDFSLKSHAPSNTQFRPRDQYLARLMDSVDMIKSNLL